jgi:hypothetical protein
MGILAKLISAGQPNLPTEVARFFLNLSITDADHARVRELSDRANEGELNPGEQDELSTYIVLMDFLELMQSRARLSLDQRSPAA